MTDANKGYEPVKESYPKPKYIFVRNDTRPVQWADPNSTDMWCYGFWLVRWT